VQCLAHGLLEIHSIPDGFVTTINERPVASRLAREEARLGNLVTNRRHELVDLNETIRVVLCYLDGNHDREALLRELLEAANRGDLSILVAGLPETKQEDMKLILRAKLAEALEALAANAFLIA
jgi:methyltransferase-like protein